MRRLMLIALCLPVIAAAQSSRFDSYNMTSANSVPFGGQAPIYTLPNSYVKVCAYPAAGNPCTNVVNVYSDPGLTSPITQPFQADVHGRFGFWAAPGEYSYNVQSESGTNYGNFTFTLAGTGGGSATFPSTPGLVYSLNSSTARNGLVTDITGLFTGCSGTLFLRADGTCGGSGLSLTTTGTTGPSSLTGTVLNIPDYTYTLTTGKVTALGTLTNDISGSAAKIGGVAVSGVPGVGQVPVALSSSTASWQTLAGVPGGSNTQVQFNNSGAFGGSNETWDGTMLGMTTGKVYFGDTSLSPSLGNFAQYNYRIKPTVELGTNQTSSMLTQIVPNYGTNKPSSAATATVSEAITTDAFSLGSLFGNVSASYAEGTGAIGEMVGLTNVAQITSDSTSSVTRVSGTDTAGENFSPSGVAGSIIGLQTVYGNGGAGSATNGYGVLVKSPSSDGSNNNITNAYGIYIQAQDRGTNKYNLYSAGASSANVFEGAVDAASVSILAPATGLASSTALGLHTVGTAISSLNQSGPSHSFYGSYWTGSVAATDGWSIAPLLGSGTNPSSTLTITHTGSTGVAAIALPMTAPSVIYSAAGTALPTCAVALNGDEAVVSDATAPTYMAAYTSGGLVTAKVICSYNGTTYSWLTH